MRILLLFLALTSFISLKAQTQLSPGLMNYTQMGARPYIKPMSDTDYVTKKWSLNKYGGFSASYGFFNGSSASVFSAPVGLQLNRQLNKNVFAFAGISAAPSYVSFSRSFVNTDINKMNTGSYSLYSRFEAGMMYVNDQRTFSVSGSISVDRGSYPNYPYNNRAGLPKQQPLNGALK
jgi:hypothetical protein